MMRVHDVLAIVLLGAALVFHTSACGGSSKSSNDEEPSAAAPKISGITPNSGPASGGTSVVITGSGFEGGNVTVTFGGVGASGVTLMGDTSLGCVTPPGTPGPATVTVVTDEGSAAQAGAFTYLDPLVGIYHLALFEGLPALGPTAQSQWGAVSAEGKGMITGGMVSLNQGGASSGPFAVPPLAYSVTPELRLTTTGATPAYEGGVGSNGRYALWGFVGPLDPPGVTVLARREGTHDLLSLNGVYTFGSIEYGGAGDVAAWGTMDFDGMGGMTWAATLNTDGVLSTPMTGPETYAVSMEGAVTSLTLGGVTYAGGIGPGGDVVLLAGATASSGPPRMLVLVRQILSGTDGVFSGDYHYVSLVDDATNMGVNWTMATGTASANGAGLLFLNAVTINADGVISTDAGGTPVGYAVDGLGRLTPTSGVAAGAGAITADGRFAFWAGGTAASSDPQLWLFVR